MPGIQLSTTRCTKPGKARAPAHIRTPGHQPGLPPPPQQSGSERHIEPLPRSTRTTGSATPVTATPVSQPPRVRRSPDQSATQKSRYDSSTQTRPENLDATRIRAARRYSSRTGRDGQQHQAGLPLGRRNMPPRSATGMSRNPDQRLATCHHKACATRPSQSHPYPHSAVEEASAQPAPTTAPSCPPPTAPRRGTERACRRAGGNREDVKARQQPAQSSLTVAPVERVPSRTPTPPATRTVRAPQTHGTKAPSPPLSSSPQVLIAHTPVTAPSSNSCVVLLNPGGEDGVASATGGIPSHASIRYLSRHYVEVCTILRFTASHFAQLWLGWPA